MGIPECQSRHCDLFKARLTIVSPLVTVVALALGQALSAERAVDAPTYWPTGGSPSVVETSSGFLISVTEPSGGFVRPMAFDGTLGPVVRLGPMAGAQLLNSSQGVVAVIARAPEFVTQLLDPTTGQPKGVPNKVGVFSAGTNVSYVSGAPGRLAWLHDLPDAGWVLTRLNDDGTVRAPDIDLSGLGKVVGNFASSPTRHWVQFDVTLASGRESTLHSFDDDGTDTYRGTFVGYSMTLAASSSAIAMVVGHDAGVSVNFFDFEGQRIGQAALSNQCRSVAAVGHDDDVWLACSEIFGIELAKTLSVSRISPDGGVRQAVVYRGDAGELTTTALIGTHGATPRLLFSRRYAELGFGHWWGSMLLPLSPDGLSATTEPSALLLRPSAQTFPSFATRLSSVPNALGWNDDALLPSEFLLRAIRVAPDGTLLDEPTRIEGLSSTFSAPNVNGRLITSTGGGDFVLASWNGFEVRPIAWPGDGGAPTKGPRVNAASVLGPGPWVVGSSREAFLLWRPTAANYDWFAQRFDTRGEFVGPQVLVANGALWDVLHDGTRYLALITDGSDRRLRVVSFGPGGFIGELSLLALQAGVWAGRMAQSNDVLLVAWEGKPNRESSNITVRRVQLDGGLLDEAPIELVQPSTLALNNLGDIGVRDGVFYVLGNLAQDAGAVPWVWRVSADGGVIDPAPIVFDDLVGVRNLVAGPTLTDGSLLIAYTRTLDDWAQSPRVFVRSIGDRLDAGSACERNTDCLSNRCAQAVCCESAEACPSEGGGPRIFQVCGCDAGLGEGALVLSALLMMSWRGAKRRSTRID